MEPPTHFLVRWLFLRLLGVVYLVAFLSLKVNRKGEALVTYRRADGRVRRVLAWGAVNALAPTADVPQVRFRYDYSGGWGKYRRLV